MIQNHLKWFYLTLAPKLAKLTLTQPPSYLKIHHAVTQITTAIALFSGQWPHTSYAIPGGVVCDPTPLEPMQADALLCIVIMFFEEEIVEKSLDDILDMSQYAQLLRLSGDLPEMLHLLEKERLTTVGQSFGRFITLRNHSLFPRAKMKTNIYRAINLDKVKEENTPRYGKSTFAKNVHYDGQFYETGPLSRAMTEKKSSITKYPYF
ncbi:hypothetical protein [Hydrogenimonas sp.]